MMATRCAQNLPIFFFFNDTATTEIYTLSLHDALPICVGSVALSFAWSVVAVWQFAQTGLPIYTRVLFTWLGSGGGKLLFPLHGGGTAEFVVNAGVLLDPLSSVWLLFVTGVGLLIHVYSTGYMSHEGGYYRFFGYLNFFMFSILTLILAK